MNRDRILYRIHTQWQEELERYVGRLLPSSGFFLVRGVGSWLGFLEEGCVIEYIGESGDRPALIAAARAIKSRYSQEAVYLTETDIRLTEV